VRHRLAVLVVAALLVLGGAGVAVASAQPRLVATGPTSVSGTDATAVFEVGGRTIRQVRYRDRGLLSYTFRLRNDGSLPVTVTGWRAPAVQARLFRLVGVTSGGDADRFTISPGETVDVVLGVRMTSCETLSARAGSFLSRVTLSTTRAGVWDDTVAVRLPEELHTGSPREAFCPNATAGSRPPG
jgi:hypothetical protein